MKNGKSPGCDYIAAEEIRVAGTSGISILQLLSCKIWREENFPEAWRKSVIVPIHKKNKLNCESYR